MTSSTVGPQSIRICPLTSIDDMPRTSPLASFLFKGGYLRGQFAAPVPRKSSSTGFNDERSAALGSTRGFPSAAWVEQARPPAASEAAPLEVVAKKSRRFW